MELFMAAAALRIILLLHLMMVMGDIIQDDENEIIKTRMEDFSGYKFPLQDDHHYDSSSFNVDSLNLQKQIDELSSFSDSPLPSVTRILYSQNDVLARRFTKNLMGLSGLSIREDDAGNIFGRWEGSEPDLPAVSKGSHIDAIPYSGKYDGVVGVLGVIEAINVLKSDYMWTSYRSFGSASIVYNQCVM